MGRPAPSTSWLLVAAGLVVAVAVAGLVTGARGGADDLDPGSPEATVRDFLEALRERDVEGVHAALAPDLRDACDEEEVRRRTRHERRADLRVTLVGTEEFDGTAEVEIRRSEHRGEPPFGGGGLHRTEIFELTDQDGTWLITQVPWGYHACPGWSR